MAGADYLVLLRRELTRAQARLKRAEAVRDSLAAENAALKAAARKKKARRSSHTPRRLSRSRPS
jgi:hypothetical protein